MSVCVWNSKQRFSVSVVTNHPHLSIGSVNPTPHSCIVPSVDTALHLCLVNRSQKRESTNLGDGCVPSPVKKLKSTAWTEVKGPLPPLPLSALCRSHWQVQACVKLLPRCIGCILPSFPLTHTHTCTLSDRPTRPFTQPPLLPSVMLPSSFTLFLIPLRAD